MRSIPRFCACLLVGLPLTIAGCTAIQTTYFRQSYVELDDPSNPEFQPYDGESSFEMVEGMDQASRDMYDRGYAMIGYSQFVSPLMTSLAPSYATKYASAREAEYAVMETPRPGESNLHGYLVTYWARVRTESFALGTYAEDLPPELLQRIGGDYNVVILSGVVDGTPAAKAGLKRDDVILAVNGVRVVSVETYVKLVGENLGKETIVSVSRQGKLLELPVEIRTPAETGGKPLAYHNAPWLQTAATDWSSLSAANITADVMRQQAAERERQAAYERGRQEALAAQRSFESDSTQTYESYMSAHRMDAPRSHTHQDWARGMPPPSAQQWNREYGQYMQIDWSAHQKDWEMHQALERQGAINMWVGNAPNIYGQLFTFPRPVVF